MKPDGLAMQRWRALRGGVLLYLVVAVGAAIGGVGRALVSLLLMDVAPVSFPWDTLAVNVLGSFVIGFYATLTEPGGRLVASLHSRQFVMTGICGGFTTFSIFSLETFRLFAVQDYPLAAANVGVSVVAWMLSVWAGAAAASHLNGLPREGRPSAPTRQSMSRATPRKAQILRIFIGENDVVDGRPLHEIIVLKAREMDLAGATVVRGVLGYGQSSRLPSAQVLRLSRDLPIVVEIVDCEEAIAPFLPILDALMTSGLVTIETVRIHRYGDHASSA